MKDDYKTKAQLIKELEELRQHLTTIQPTGKNYNNKKKPPNESDFSNAVIDSLPGIFYLLDDEGRLLRWNKNLATVTHYTPEELSKLHATDPFLGDDKEKVSKAIRGAFKKGKNTVEAVLVSKRGTKHPYFFTGIRVTLNRKQCLIGMGIDISERKKLERGLNRSHQELEEKVAQRTSELKKANEALLQTISAHREIEAELMKAKNFLESIFKTSADGILIADLHGNITMVNDALEKMFGYSKIELLGKHTAEMGFDEKKYTVSGKELIQQLMIKGSVSGVERIWKKKDGSSVDIEMNIALLKDSTGNFIGSVGSIRDITERKQAEEKLRASEARARVLLNVPLDAILLIDNQGTILDCNEGFSQRFHKTPDEVIGSLCWDLYPPELVKSRKGLLDKVIQSGKAARFEDLRQGMCLDNVLYPITDAQGRITTCAIFSRDITDRKRTEEELIQNQDQLRLLASQLTKSEAHERRKIASYLHDHIGQELFVLKLLLEHLKQSLSSKDTHKTLVSIIKKANQLMTDTRSLTYELSPPILYELGFEAAVEWLVGEINNTHTTTITLEDDGQAKLLDETTTVLLFQAVRELLNNITKHAEARTAKVSIERDAARIVIKVNDDGVGVKGVEVDLLKGKSLGFGLYSIRERLKYLGGDLDIKSALNRGTQITIKVPITS